MKRFSEQFYKKAETVRLRADEKRELKERLVAYMEYHPLPVEVGRKAQAEEAVPIAAEPFFNLSFGWIMRGAGAFAVVLLIGIPVLAEHAMPGDTLYAIKVQVNEELRSTLTFDSYEKVEWETERLNRRIAEARLLASEGRLTEEVEAEVAEAVRTHTEAVKKEIKGLREVDEDEATMASIALDTTLEVQSASLRAEGEESGVTGNNALSTGLLADAIDASREVTTASDATTIPAYPKLMARVEQNTTRIYELSGGLLGVIPKNQSQDINRRMEDINRSIKSATEMAKTNEEGARGQLLDVLQRTQRLIVYMTELEVSETFDIETLVPVVLTDEEKQQKREELTKSLNDKISKISTTLVKIESVEISEKAAHALVELRAAQEKISDQTLPYESFKSVAVEAHALADDTLRLFEQQAIVVSEIQEDGEETSDQDENASSTEEEATEIDSAATGTDTEVVSFGKRGVDAGRGSTSGNTTIETQS